MKYTAAQLKLLNETQWGWAVRGDKRPEPKPKVAPRKRTPEEREEQLKKTTDSYLKAQRPSDWVERLLEKQRKVSGRREARRARERGEVPPSEAETWITGPTEE